MTGKPEPHVLKYVWIKSERVGVWWGGVVEGSLSSGKPMGVRIPSVGWTSEAEGGSGKYRKCSGMGEVAQGVKKAHHLKNKKIKNFAIREAGEGNQDTKEDSQGYSIKKETMFLLLPRLCAWVECLHVDHGLPSEDALAVVDRDGVCDGILTYSTGMDEGGAVRGSWLPSSSSSWLS